MSVLIVGSVALDSVKTPFGEVERVQGGSAVFSSLAARFFNQIKLVGVVGQDYPAPLRQALEDRGINLSGLEVAEGDTFFWRGFYDYDLNTAHSLETALNVFGEFSPKLPDLSGVTHCFLANMAPAVQMQVLDNLPRGVFVLMDTMNYWIESQKDALTEVIKRVDAVLMNDAELRQFTGQFNLLEGARQLLGLGPKTVFVKKGEHGSLTVQEDSLFLVPAYPLQEVKDPTGAGDSFAGGLIGMLSQGGHEEAATLRQAVVIGNVMASFTVTQFSTQALLDLTHGDLLERYHQFKDMTEFTVPVLGK